MALNFSDYKCEICGKTCTQVAYATFLCDNIECVAAAHDARGGPGGHMNHKKEKPIVPMDAPKE